MVLLQHSVKILLSVQHSVKSTAVLHETATFTIKSPRCTNETEALDAVVKN